jgi:hypothetical protein
MRYSVTLEYGGRVVWDTITRQIMTHPATSEETQEVVKEWNARCVTAWSTTHLGRRLGARRRADPVAAF